MDKVEFRSVDAISSLPDDVLTHILSFLPTKRAVFTSIRSKRWRNLFTMMSHLRFDDTDYLYPKVTKQRKDHARQTFRALVDTTMSLQQQEEVGNSNKWLKKFSLICEDEYSDIPVDPTYSSANFLDSLLEASLDLFLPKYSSIEPWKFVTCICSVHILHLSSNTVELMIQCFDHWGSNGGFPLFKNLVKLSFKCKIKKGWKVLWSLLNNSPKLETLIIKGCFCSIRRSCEDSIEGNALKLLKICGYKGTRRELMQVQRFLLELEFLQVMKVQVGDKKIDDDKKLKLTKDLLALPKLSSNCQIQFL
ncbi:hypothetical protein Bca4012_056934 [Brassica carinata]